MEVGLGWARGGGVGWKAPEWTGCTELGGGMRRKSGGWGGRMVGWRWGLGRDRVCFWAGLNAAGWAGVRRRAGCRGGSVYSGVGAKAGGAGSMR